MNTSIPNVDNVRQIVSKKMIKHKNQTIPDSNDTFIIKWYLMNLKCIVFEVQEKKNFVDYITDLSVVQ